MAGKIKISNEKLKILARNEKKRDINTRVKRKYFLIVCEGQETEPNYFKGLTEELPKGVLSSIEIDIHGTGRNTMSLIDEAIRLKDVFERKTHRKIDKLWTVFDRDSFPEVDFNNALLRCKNSRPEIGCAWSNEAFELWYLLHFDYFENAISRNDYQRMLETRLRPLIGDGYSYQKNSAEMYNLLKAHGNSTKAIKNAKRLARNFEGREDFSNHNPCTMVYKLVEELFDLNVNG